MVKIPPSPSKKKEIINVLCWTYFKLNSRFLFEVRTEFIPILSDQRWAPGSTLGVYESHGGLAINRPFKLNDTVKVCQIERRRFKLIQFNGIFKFDRYANCYHQCKKKKFYINLQNKYQRIYMVFNFHFHTHWWAMPVNNEEFNKFI